jgi:hypothetical protein
MTPRPAGWAGGKEEAAAAVTTPVTLKGGPAVGPAGLKWQ